MLSKLKWEPSNSLYKSSRQLLYNDVYMSAPPALWRQTQNKFKRNIFKNRFDTFVYMSDSHSLFLNPFLKINEDE